MWGLIPMADNYILFPATKKGLSCEMKRALDSYSTGGLTNTELENLLRAWKDNCDFMVQEGRLDRSIAVSIGKRRSMVVEKMMF